MRPLHTCQKLFLDFDGVVADSLEESLLVSWYGAGRGDWSRADTPQALAARVPEDYRAHFRMVRSYARTLEEFLVPALDDIATPESQADFVEIFAAVPPARRADFVRQAQAFRDFLRSEHLDAWGAMHEVYQEIPDLVRRFAGHVHIVTAKDDVSARVALGLNGLDRAVETITGGATDKPRVIRDILAEAGQSEDQAIFVDDNITNVGLARQAGLRAFWASWGWQQGEEHRDAAERQGLPRLRLEDLIGIQRTH